MLTSMVGMDLRSIYQAFGIDKTDIACESISSTVSAEMKRDAIIAITIATIGMLVYIWFRFKDIRFASSAVLALLHDVLVVLAFYAVAKGYSFFTGANHLHSIINPGTPGRILSAGIILPLNIAVGFVVTMTMYSFYALFTKEEI